MNIRATIELLEGVVEDTTNSAFVWEEDSHKSNLVWDFHFGLTYCIDILKKLERATKNENRQNIK